MLRPIRKKCHLIGSHSFLKFQTAPQIWPFGASLIFLPQNRNTCEFAASSNSKRIKKTNTALVILHCVPPSTNPQITHTNHLPITKLEDFFATASIDDNPPKAKQAFLTVLLSFASNSINRPALTSANVRSFLGDCLKKP